MLSPICLATFLAAPGIVASFVPRSPHDRNPSPNPTTRSAAEWRFVTSPLRMIVLMGWDLRTLMDEFPRLSGRIQHAIVDRPEG